MNSIRARQVWVGLALVTLMFGYLLRHLATDDPFITYRYAANLAGGAGFVYTPGSTTLSTTTPFYALLLGLLARIWPNIPLVSNIFSALCLWLTAAILVWLGERQEDRLIGYGAGLFLVLFPLGWLSIGFEAALYLLLVTAAFALYQNGLMDHLPGEIAVGILLGLATLTRYDALVPAAVLGMHYLWTHRRVAWRALLAYLVIITPMVIWLTILYGSPLPDTLLAKRAQQAVGITGFYPYTTFLEGLVILLQGWLEQTVLHLLWLGAVVVGLLDSVLRRRWVLLWTAWAVAHIVAYALLGTTPYFWHYLPILPAVALLAAGGVNAIGGGLNHLICSRFPFWPSKQGKVWLVTVMGLLMIAPLLISDVGIVRAVGGASLPPPDAASSKVLPEAKVDVYRRAGEWLAQNTAEDALIGVTEVGIMGFYAKRPMLDFLGLLNTNVARKLADGDLSWALAAYRPDYVAITAVNPLYSTDLTADTTFQTLYRPVKRFIDDRFWGSPVTVYQRTASELADADVVAWSGPGPVLFGEQLALAQARVARATVATPTVPGQLISLEFDWITSHEQPTDYRLFIHLVGESDRIIAQLDQLLLPIEEAGGYTSTWQADTRYTTRHHLIIPETALTPDTLEIRMGLYDPVTSVRLSMEGDTDVLLLPWALELQADSEGQAPFDFGSQLELSGYAVEDKPLVAPGESLAVQLYWRALSEMDSDYKVFVHLVNRETGEKIAQDDAPPGEREAPTHVWQVGDEHTQRHQLVAPATAPAGIYDIWVGLYDADSGRRLPLLDNVGNPYGDHIRLGPIRIGES